MKKENEEEGEEGEGGERKGEDGILESALLSCRVLSFFSYISLAFCRLHIYKTMKGHRVSVCGSEEAHRALLISTAVTAAPRARTTIKGRRGGGESRVLIGSPHSLVRRVQELMRLVFCIIHCVSSYNGQTTSACQQSRQQRPPKRQDAQRIRCERTGTGRRGPAASFDQGPRRPRTCPRQGNGVSQ